MAWELVTSPNTIPPWVQWIDRANASGWVAVLRRLLTAPHPAEAGDTAAILVEGRLQVLALWRALGAVGRACDLPSFVFAPYAQARLLLGNRFEAGEGFGRTLPNLPPGTLYADLWSAMRAKNSEGYRRVMRGDPLVPEIVWRVDLRSDCTVWAEHLAAVNPPGGGTAENSCVGVGAPAGGGLSSWDCWTWRESWPSVISADRRVTVRGLPPLEVFWLAGRDIASQIVEDGVDGIVSRSRAYAMAKNILTARAIGVELPEAIVEFAARAETARRSSPWDVNLMAGAGATIGTAVGVLASNPVLGALLGAGFGLGQALFAIFGQAQGYDVDAFGRREPVLERTWIGGELSPPTAPAFELEPPPGAGGPGPIWTPVFPGGDGASPPPPPPPPPQESKGGKAAALALLTYFLLGR